MNDGSEGGEEEGRSRGIKRRCDLKRKIRSKEIRRFFLSLSLSASFSLILIVMDGHEKECKNYDGGNEIRLRDGD